MTKQDAAPGEAMWKARYELLRDIGALLEGDHPDEELLRKLADRIIRASGADGGFLIRVGWAAGGREPELQVALARNYLRGDVQRPEFEISRTLILRALQSGKPLRVENALAGGAPLSRSIHALKVLSVIAIPLVRAGESRPHALIYLDRRRPGRHFTADDLSALGEAVQFASRALEAALASRQRAAGALPVHPLIRAELVGDSEVMRRAAAAIEKAARSDATALVLGETGTGKELAASLLHRLGRRAAEPFVAVNCAALPRDLIEAELFGHEAGAFTGARGRRVGKFEEAGGGTLFLDEIGDLSPELQAKLLRVIETRRIPVLGGRERPFPARLVAATHQPLERMVREGRFRQDLYYRLAVLELRLPALRERREDIPALAAHFAALNARRQGRPAPALTRSAEQFLARRAWPGNVRELAHLVERAIVFGEGAVLDRPDFVRLAAEQEEGGGGAPLTASAYEQRRLALEREFVGALLAVHHGNVSAASKASGMSRAYLYELVKRHYPEALGPARGRPSRRAPVRPAGQ